jgi:hypothetical protein
MPFEFPAKRALFAMIVIQPHWPWVAAPGEGTVKSAAEAAGMATTPQESKKFVQETRPAIRIYPGRNGGDPRAAKRKTVDEFKKSEPNSRPSEAPMMRPAPGARTLPAPAPATA